MNTFNISTIPDDFWISGINAALGDFEETEPNDNYNQTNNNTVIPDTSNGNNIKGTFNSSSDEDWFKFSVSSSGYINALFDINNTQYMDSGFMIFDSSFNIVAFSYVNNGAYVSFEITPGTYYIRIYDTYSGYGEDPTGLKYTFRFKFYSYSNSLVFKAKDNSGSPISNAEVRISTTYNNNLTALTNVLGIAIIPTGFVTGTGNIGFNVTADGYAAYVHENLIKRTAAIYDNIKLISNNAYSIFNHVLPDNYINPAPISGQHFGWRNHNGVDYHTGADISQNDKGIKYHDMIPANRPYAISAFDGDVHFKGFKSGCGNTVQIKKVDNGITYYVTYMHLEYNTLICPNINNPITVGGSIGRVSNTVNSSTIGDSDMKTHLHFSVSTSDSVTKTSRAFLDPLAFNLY